MDEFNSDFGTQHKLCAGHQNGSLLVKMCESRSCPSLFLARLIGLVSYSGGHKADFGQELPNDGSLLSGKSGSLRLLVHEKPAIGTQF